MRLGGGERENDVQAEWERVGESVRGGEADAEGEREGLGEKEARGVRVPPTTLGSKAVGKAGTVGPFAVGVTSAVTREVGVPVGEGRPVGVPEREWGPAEVAAGVLVARREDDALLLVEPPHTLGA